MIRYSSTRAELQQRISAVRSDWLSRAGDLTNAVVASGGHDGTPSAIWSEIRTVFVDIQFRKCAFCERDMAATPLGGSEQAVEHYRPKGATKPWRPDVTDGFWELVGGDLTDGNADGYYWLAWHEENYATSCAICNSRLKANYFPIFGEPGAATRTPRQLRSEKPALPYPIGDVDVDPETILTFEGILPIPASSTPAIRRRALVTIRFFALDTREELLYGRAQLILKHKICRTVRNDPQVGAIASASLAAMTLDAAPHAACMRAFDRLVTQDPVKADQLVETAKQYLISVGALGTPGTP